MITISRAPLYQMKDLQLYNCSLNGKAIAELVKGKWHNLEIISLGDNNLSDQDIRHLTKADWPNLYKL